MSKFSPKFTKDENGWYNVPRDTKMRNQLWPEGVSKHPAKYSCFLVWELAKHLTTPGQTILDPMAGTGTTMIATLDDRKVICIEVEEKYHEMQQYTLGKIIEIKPEAKDDVMLLLGDCNKFLPIKVDCIIFSPPYADQLKRQTVSGIAAEDTSSFAELTDYSRSIWNIGKLNFFMYFQRMESIYKKLAQSAPVMAVVVKDNVVHFERRPLVQQTIALCKKVGWKLVEEVKMSAPGSEFIKIHESHGEEMVKDESVLIMRSKL